MKDPKTTISGILLVVSSVAVIISHLLGGTVSVMDLQNLMAAVAGLGLIGAADNSKSRGA